MSDFQEQMTKLCNVAKTKMDAASYQDFESLLRELHLYPTDPRGMDELDDSKADKIIQALSDALGTDDDLDELVALLANAAGQDDEVPAFKGKPEVGGGMDRKRRFRLMAIDHARGRRSTFNRMFPEANRLEAVPTQRGPVSPLAQDGTCSSEKFAETFPDAARIKL